VTPPDGTEIVAELAQDELDAAVAQLVPPHFVAGADPRTPRQLRVDRRPRERGAALVWDLPAGTSVHDLLAPAQELSRRARTIVWDRLPSVALVEYRGGVETSRLDPEHNGGWRGTSWSAIERGEVRAPFAEGLVSLLREHRDAELVAGLLDDTYGVPRRAAPLATYHHAFELAAESPALAPLLRAVIARVVRDGRTTVRGLGELVCHPGPPRTIGHRPRAEPIELDEWRELSAAERAAAAEALRRVIDRLVPATDLVVPGLACFDVTELPAYRGANPRTGQPIVVPGKRIVGVTLQPPP
jgi:nucleoid DNA-binding protein